ncbi:heat shock protein 70, partial [Reticulomyxa filosa]
YLFKQTKNIYIYGKAVKKAGEEAGLKVMSMLDEEIAVLIAYGLNNKQGIDKIKNVLIFDMGGRKCTSSIVAITKNGMEIKAVQQGPGGDACTTMLVTHFINEIKTTHNVDIRDDNDKHAETRLRIACNIVKHRLSLEQTVDTCLKFNSNDFTLSISQTKFESLCEQLFCECVDTMTKALKECAMNKSDITEVVMVGGSTFIPKINHLIRDFFKDTSPPILNSINANEVVAHGAAIYAAFSNNQNAFADRLWTYQRPSARILCEDPSPPKIKIDSTYIIAMYKILKATLPKAHVKIYAETENFIQELLDKINHRIKTTDDNKAEYLNNNIEVKFVKKHEMVSYLQTEQTSAAKNEWNVDIDTTKWGEFEKWLITQTQNLEATIKTALKQEADEFVIDGV